PPVQSLHRPEPDAAAAHALLPRGSRREQGKPQDKGVQINSGHVSIQVNAGYRCRKPAPSVAAGHTGQPAARRSAPPRTVVCPGSIRSYNTEDARHPTPEWAKG